MSLPHPTLDLPPPLRGTDEDSFAEYTVRTRLHEILRRTMDENDFSSPAEAQLRALDAEIPHTPIRTFDGSNTDRTTWMLTVLGYRDKNWLEVPWFFAETYFYRRILHATGYFKNGHVGVDPFEHQKTMAFDAHTDAIANLAARVNAISESDAPDPDVVQALLATSLWGNRADLSLWPADGTPSDDPALHDDAIVADDRARVAAWLTDRAPLARIDVMLDNYGFELVCDLALVAGLLKQQAVHLVLLHAKAHPTFVSDAISANVYHIIAELVHADDDATRTFGETLQTFLQTGRLGITDHLYWTSPKAGWEMPHDLAAALREGSLVISKGDANYRRLLGDRHWDYTTPFSDVMQYFPTPILALRTLKSEVAVGLSQAAINTAAAEDDDWIVNGERGVVQFREA